MKIGILNLDLIEEQLGNLTDRSGSNYSSKDIENYYVQPVKKDSLLEKYITQLNLTDPNK